MAKTLTKSQVYIRLRAMVKDIGVPEYAKRCGVSRTYIDNVLADERELTDKLLKPLNIKRLTVYQLAE